MSFRSMDVQMAVNRTHEASRLSQNQLLNSNNHSKDLATQLDRQFEEKLRAVKEKDEVLHKTVKDREERRGREEKEKEEEKQEKENKKNKKDKGIDLRI